MNGMFPLLLTMQGNMPDLIFNQFKRLVRNLISMSLLQTIADFIEIQNKPFWDEYERYYDEQEQ